MTTKYYFTDKGVISSCDKHDITIGSDTIKITLNFKISSQSQNCSFFVKYGGDYIFNDESPAPMFASSVAKTFNISDYLDYIGKTLTFGGTNSNGTISHRVLLSVEYSHFLHYDANGGSGAPSKQSYTSSTSSSYTFTISSKVPTREGYIFKGWSTSKDATTASYQPGGRIVVRDSATLYAVWKEYKPLMKVNINGTWHESIEVYGKVDGIWKEADTIYAKVNGIWKESQ